MALINTALLVHNATKAGHIAHRAHQVQQDPAVQKTCSEARDDVVRAANSIARAAFEVHSAWRRTSPSGGGAFTGLHA